MAEKQEHPKAKWFRAIADGETVECQIGNAWFELTTPAAVHEFLLNKDPDRYRIKPQTITIGRYEVAEPMKDAPEKGTRYFYLDALEDNSVISSTWDNFAGDLQAVKAGMCWLKHEDAELAAKAISELLLGK